jgi:hypothetical protein
MQTIRIALAAATLAVLPAAAHAYDNKPTTPPPSSSGGSGGTPVAVPAPAAIGLFAMGVAGLAVARRRRR